MTVLNKAQKTGIQAVTESLAEIPVADAVLTADRTALLPQLLSATPIYILYFLHADRLAYKMPNRLHVFLGDNLSNN